MYKKSNHIPTRAFKICQPPQTTEWNNLFSYTFEVAAAIPVQAGEGLNGSTGVLVHIGGAKGANGANGAKGASCGAGDGEGGRMPGPVGPGPAAVGPGPATVDGARVLVATGGAGVGGPAVGEAGVGLVATCGAGVGGGATGEAVGGGATGEAGVGRAGAVGGA